MRNVSRAWAYETGLAAGVELGPGNDFGNLFLSYLSTRLTRNSRKRILRVFRTGLRTWCQIVKYGRYEHTCISWARQTNCDGEFEAYRGATKCPDVRCVPSYSNEIDFQMMARRHSIPANRWHFGESKSRRGLRVTGWSATSAAFRLPAAGWWRIIGLGRRRRRWAQESRTSSRSGFHGWKRRRIRSKIWNGNRHNDFRISCNSWRWTKRTQHCCSDVIDIDCWIVENGRRHNGPRITSSWERHGWASWR